FVLGRVHETTRPPRRPFEEDFPARLTERAVNHVRPPEEGITIHFLVVRDALNRPPHALDIGRLLRGTRIACRLGGGSRRPRRWLVTRYYAVDALAAPGAGTNDVP